MLHDKLELKLGAHAISDPADSAHLCSAAL